jgi:general secretion pathway protein D
LFDKVDAVRRKRPTPTQAGAAAAAPAPGTPPTTTVAVPPGQTAATPAAATDRDPPGSAPDVPTTMDKIAQATDVPFRAKPGGHLVKFNLQDADLAELVNHISGLTGRRFIYGAKVRQVKATVVSPEPVTIEEAYQAFLSILEANGMTVVPHGRFMKIVDSGGVVTQPTPVVARGEPVADADRYVTRLYRLQAVSTDEAVALVSKFKSKDGDVSAYPAGRLLIITDTGTQVRRLIRILEEVDIGGSGQRLWIEPVHNGSAPDMAKRVNELFELGGTPGQPPGAGAKASGLSKVIADEQTNSLIIVGTDDSYSKLLELLKRLDAHSTDGGRVHVLPLQHAIADELAPTLSQMLGGSGGGGGGGAKGGQAASAAGNAGGMFEGEVRITPDKATNSLIITSSNRDYATLRLVLDKLDRPRRQVFIEAVVMDLDVSDSTTLGVAFHAGTTVDTGGQQSLLLGGFQGAKSIGFPASSADLLSGLAAGMRGPDLEGTENLLPASTGLSIPAFGVVMNALSTSGKSNVLATPHIIATDNVAAEIQIGQNIALQQNLGGGVSNLTGPNGGSLTTNPLGLLGGLSGGFAAPRQDVGNKIKVTPHINESNQVRLEIDQESSSQGAASGDLGAVSINKRTANTTVVVADQQTVVIGGLMQDGYTTSRTKVPVLGDLPILGALFRSTTTSKKKTNLLLILTPHVIRDQSDLRRIFERKMQERQEFLDRYFVFAQGEEWTPPRDWSRTNGLVEDIRKSFAEIREDEETRSAAEGPADAAREPSEPLELPGAPRVGSDAAGGGGRNRRAPGGTPQPATPAVPPAPANPAVPPPAPAPAPGPQGRTGDLDESPVRITPIARSVYVERVE